MARSARCDVRWNAAVFVKADEMTVPADLLQSHAFRRLLLQIGGANIADRGSRRTTAYFIVARRRKDVSAHSSSAQRRRNPN
jgi:hypothetical protein